MEKIDIKDYNRQIELAEKDVQNGDVYTQEEVEEIVKQWRR